MSKILTAITVLALGLSVAQAHAQGQGQRGASFIASWDMSGTGYVTLEDMLTRRSDLFDMFDADGNGYLEADELALMAETVAAQDEIRGERQAVNRDGRKGQGRNTTSAGEIIHEAMTLEFNDADGDGRISRDEFLAATARLFAILDSNGDGRLDADDFR